MNSQVNIYKVGNKGLHIGETKIFWENQLFDSVIEHPTQIRYGIAPIELDMFTIGRNFKIQLRNENDDRLNISLKSYFGIRKARKHQLYEQIADEIWDQFFATPLAELIYNWENGQKIIIGNFEIDNSSVTCTRGITRRFDEMQLLPRFDHLLINSSEQHDKYMKLNYLEDWNWPLVNEILHRAIKLSA